MARDWRQPQKIEAQLDEVRAAGAALPIDERTTSGRYVHALQTLRAIGPGGAWVLATEILGWREIRNPRKLAAPPLE